MESSNLSSAGTSGASVLFGGIVRMAGWLNGLAALMLIGLSLTGSDIALHPALSAFLVGLFLCGLSGVFAYWGDVKLLNRLLGGRARQRGYWLLILLATLSCLTSLLAFAAGCLMTTVNAEADSAALDTKMVFERTLAPVYT